MEDLLASIRKAITEDSAARTAVSASNRSQSMSEWKALVAAFMLYEL